MRINSFVLSNTKINGEMLRKDYLKREETKGDDDIPTFAFHEVPQLQPIHEVFAFLQDANRCKKWTEKQLRRLVKVVNATGGHAVFTTTMSFIFSSIFVISMLKEARNCTDVLETKCFTLKSGVLQFEKLRKILIEGKADSAYYEFAKSMEAKTNELKNSFVTMFKKSNNTRKVKAADRQKIINMRGKSVFTHNRVNFFNQRLFSFFVLRRGQKFNKKEHKELPSYKFVYFEHIEFFRGIHDKFAKTINPGASETGFDKTWRDFTVEGNHAATEENDGAPNNPRKRKATGTGKPTRKSTRIASQQSKTNN